jgi:hypothetical protein
MELGLHREQYDTLVRSLTADGHSVDLVRPVERRDLGLELPALYDVAVRVGDVAASLLALQQLISVMRKTLRGKDERTRVGAIYLPDGTVHKFDTPSD